MKPLDPKGDGLLDDKVAYTPYSIVNDAFDVRAFQEIKDRSAKLLKLEERGSAEYEQFPELQQDMFDALYKYDPELRKEWELQRDFLLNRRITEELMETPKYKELRALTSLDIVNSVVGVDMMAEEMLEIIKRMKKEREALQALLDAGQALDAAAGAGAQQQGEGGGNPNQKPKNESLTLEEAKAQYEKAMENFREATHRDEFKQNINRLATKVKDAVKETSDLITNWGLGASGSFQRRPANEKMGVIDRLRKSHKLNQIAKMAGRHRRLAQIHRKERVKQGLDETYSVKQGSDVAQLVPYEMLRFLHPETRVKMMADLLEGKTLVYQIRGKQKKGKGPIIVCIDSSGSMDGQPEIWAKSVAMILLEIAREQKRDFYCVHFSSGYRQLHTNEFLKNVPFDIEQVIDMAEYFEAGGTEFEPPLNLARQKIGTDKIYQKADIVFITDGCSVVRDAWLVDFMRWKKENKVNIYSVLIDAYDNSNGTLKQFSDKVEHLSNMKEGQDDLAVTLFVNM